MLAFFPDYKYTLSRSSGIPAFLNWYYRHRPLVLTYHGIYDGPGKIGDLPPTFVHVRDFREQITWISKRFRILTPEEFLGRLKAKAFYDPNSALITFDDGYESYYRLAEPVLEEFGIKPIVFMPTEYLEDQKPFWFDVAWFFLKRGGPKEINSFIKTLEIEKNVDIKGENLSEFCVGKMKSLHPFERENLIQSILSIFEDKIPGGTEIKKLFYPMTQELILKVSSRGVQFGGHTHSHTVLSILSDSMAEMEIRKGKEILESLLGTPCELFAYPNGSQGDFSEIHKQILKDLGFQAAFSLTQERTLVQRDPMGISRINVVPEDTVKALSIRCMGLVPFFRWLGKG
jgi:peptidoglycan/xylan/chitin deacetylase (PgdA/CDA1 family)